MAKKTVYVVIDSSTSPPFEGQRLTCWPDDVIVESVQPIGSEHIVGAYGALHPRRWKVVLRPPTQEENAEEEARLDDELASLSRAPKWWEVWR